MEQEVVYAILPTKVANRPKTYSKGRVCTTEGCDTILSQYNKAGQCYLHQPVKRPRLRGKMPSEVMEQKSKNVNKCRSCSQRRRYYDGNDEIAEVYVDGIRHYEGSSGKATLCEGL